MAPGIEITAADFKYHDQYLFQGLNLTLAAGQWTCLLGPSGVGKTSLLRLIAGLNTSATSKSIVATDHKPIAGRIAYMAQQESLLPWLKVIDNLTIGDRLRGRTTQRSDQDRAYQLLHQVGLRQVGECLPRQLSGGMKQRVLLARLLYEDKPIILLDEPFGSVDIITRTAIQQLAATVLAGKTVLLVTHDPMEALQLGHHIFILSGQPAHITTQIALPGDPPRELTDPALLSAHATILQQLSQAKEVLDDSSI